MKKQQKSKRPTRVSPVAIAIGTRALAKYNAISATLPRCGAKARTTGEPCRQVAMANGRCYCHGGTTPSGKNWHKPRWPDASAPGAEEKLGRKLRDLARAEKKRAKRLKAMTPEEREKHEAWQRTHRPGSPSARAQAREARKMAKELAWTLQAPPSKTDPEMDRIQRKIDDLEARLSSPRQPSIFD